MSIDPIKMIITVVHRGRGEKVMKQLGVSNGLHYIALGHGTAHSEVQEMLGVGETEKDVVFSLVAGSRAKRFMEDLHDGMSLHLPDRGIVFQLSLTAASRIVERTIHSNLAELKEEEGEALMENEGKFSMILAIVNRGYSEDVMAAAKKQGARGGTIIHARGTGSEDVGEFLGMKLQPEKEIVMILVRHKDKAAVMNAIGKEAGMHSKAHGFLVALPVEDFGGIA